MRKFKNKFIFFGAVHQDFVFKLKNDLIKYRTNPISQNESYGGVAHNVAKIIGSYENTSFFSLQTDKETKKYLIDQNIDFTPLNKKIEKRFYGIIIDKYQKLQLGIANTDAYENFTLNTINFKFINKSIVVDLNFSMILINKIIKKYYKNNNIVICGTSPFKIWKIKKNLKKIHTLILNKEELYSLTNIRNIIKSIKYIKFAYPNITLVVSNADKKTYALNRKKLISCKPPKINVVNENGAGDVMAGIYLYSMSKNESIETALTLAVAAGTLHAQNKFNFNFNSLKKITNKIIQKKERLHV
jgi:sugar/nucleoside kinase (ribokinase family)